MRVVLIMFFLCVVVYVLVLAVSTHEEKEEFIAVVNYTVCLIQQKIIVLWDKVNGIEPFYMEDEEAQVEEVVVELVDGLSEIFEEREIAEEEIEW